MIYAYSENFMLVFSHDEVVHGKGTLIGKMPGEIKEKFANLRLTYAYMMLHPGKKLLFMGQEFAQQREWSEMRSLDWYLLEEGPHQGIHRLIKDFNHLYLENSSLYYNDSDVIE